MELSSAFIIMLILLTLTAFASSSEMAIASVSRIRIKAKAEIGDKKAERILNLVNNADRTITTIVVLNNIVNILLPTISTILFTSLFGPTKGVIISTVFMTIVILLFGEILPKIYGKINAEKYLYNAIGIISFVVKIMYPIAIFFIKITDLIQKIFYKKEEEAELVEVEEEILTMIEEAEEEGKIEEAEEELIRNAIEFNDIRVEDILQPKRSMVMVNINEDNHQILKVMTDERFSRIPVYENDTDNIIGILSEREFFTEYIKNTDFDIRPILRGALFIPDTLKISKLLPDLQVSKSHMAIVLDERATVQGLVTVEDILEELVGEIWDEHDDVVFESRKISGIEYEVTGEISINGFNEIFEIKDIESEQLEATIAGYVIEIAEKIPTLNEIYEDENFTFYISEMDGNKIERIIVKLKETQEENNEIK